MDYYKTFFIPNISSNQINVYVKPSERIIKLYKNDLIDSE